MKKTIGLLFVMTFLSYYSNGQTFLGFKSKQNSTTIPLKEFDCKSVDTLAVYSPDFGIFSNVYFSKNKHVGFVFDPTKIDSIELIIGGYSVDPLLGKKYTESQLIDITQFLKYYFELKYKAKYPNPTNEDLNKINQSVENELSSYIDVDGELLVILFRSDINTTYRLKAEEYGFIYFNKSLPINAQFSGVPASSDLNNLVNLYYPFQIIPKNAKKRWTTNVLKRVSFGPYLLSSFDGSVKIQGGGIMTGIGLSENGTPILGCGIGFANKNSPFFMYTINPIEIMRIMFNPKEVKSIFKNY